MVCERKLVAGSRLVFAGNRKNNPAIAGAVAPELCVNARGQVASWKLLFERWDQADFAASAAALEAAGQGTDRSTLPLQANRHSFFLSLSPQYAEAFRSAEEGVRIAIEIEV